MREPELTQLVRDLFGLVATIARDPRWSLNDAEARSISAPSARMLARHTPVQRAIRKYSDPLVAFGALAAVVSTRVAVRSMRPTPPPPARPAATSPGSGASTTIVRETVTETGSFAAAPGGSPGASATTDPAAAASARAILDSVYSDMEVGPR